MDLINGYNKGNFDNNYVLLSGYGLKALSDFILKISSTDNAVVRFDGTSGSILNSGVIINDSNNITASSFIKSGGTSSQFLKADGSIDTNAYLPLTGGTLNRGENTKPLILETSNTETTTGVQLTFAKNGTELGGLGFDVANTPLFINTSGTKYELLHTNNLPLKKGSGLSSILQTGTTASGNYSHAEGDSTLAEGEASHAEGYSTTALGDYSHAEGFSTETSIDSSHAEGSFTIASGEASHAEGFLATALGDYSHAEGFSYTKAPNSITSSTSYNDIRTAWNSIKFSLAQKSGSHVEGKNSLALGNYSHAEGLGSEAEGLSSHAEGDGTSAVGYFSHSEGDGTSALGEASHSEGSGTSASGDNSHSEGYSTTASGYNSHAEGNSTNKAPNTITSSTSSANVMTAWTSKKFSLAQKDGSHVEGKDNLTLGDYSHAEGLRTLASNFLSHAEGLSTTASGYSSHAEGSNTIAYGDCSHAEGNRTAATNQCEHAEGQYNKSNTGTLHSVGIGTGSNDRKNAFEIMSDGKAFFYNLGGYNGTNPANANSLQTVIATLLAEINNLKEHETKTYYISDSCQGDYPDAFFNFFENEGSYVIHDSEFIEFFIDLLRGKHPRLIFTIMHSDGNGGIYPEAVFEVEYLYHPILTESQYYTGTTSIRALFKIPYANTSSIIGSSSSGENSIYCNLALLDNAIEVSNVTKQQIYDFSNNSNI